MGRTVVTVASFAVGAVEGEQLADVDVADAVAVGDHEASSSSTYLLDRA